ncbi:serine--tRNA ligase [Sphaerisporangium sp. TRM90804]|uniref:serine--tRNA ligase n=1 Tax=Sphaerisporangium sp. TRM90804 TaxID=3031113 RepID=UPI002448AA10|nr:serine--tRNA ligase [Sphaerisporangium sp. TRM90804]MDH2428333.1 serine--tRNA ligase [Sphaerisporangium sp. TRM90804]
MHDPRSLLEAEASARLARRGYALDEPALRALVADRTGLVKERDGLRTELNRSARAADAAAQREQARAGKERLRKLEDELRACEAALSGLLLTVPNLPADEAPDGGPQDPPVVVGSWGTRPEFDFPARDHMDLGTALGVLDPVRAAKLSGSRFAVTRGAAARLERALAMFLLDLHTGEHGYVEHGVPHLVSAETMTGTGQLPKFADDLFHTRVADRDLLLIPTAEVPLVNLYRGEQLDPAALPVALVAHTPCYRGEAGSYGRDTRGLVRLHQFDKVELVRLCHPDEAGRELALLLGHAEACLRRLGLHYRVVELRSGDLGFAARRTFDIEVWLPGQDAYREISSCSDCGEFQARRAGIKVRERGGRKTYAATLNGSGLPIGRTLVAILEQYQRADGSVGVPPALVPYTGFSAIDPTGTPVA